MPNWNNDPQGIVPPNTSRTVRGRAANTVAGVTSVTIAGGQEAKTEILA